MHILTVVSQTSLINIFCISTFRIHAISAVINSLSRVYRAAERACNSAKSTLFIDKLIAVTLEGAYHLASFPGLPHLQLLIAPVCKNGRGRRGESSHVIRGTTVMHRHASYQQSKTCTRPILHSALATKMGQAPTESYTERMKHTQATRHDSKGLPSDKRENAQL